MLEKFFRLRENKTSVRIEIVAGLEKKIVCVCPCPSVTCRLRVP